MRKLFTLSTIVATLSLLPCAAFADYSEQLAGKTISLGEALQTPADIEEGTWYVVATRYDSRLYDNMYMYDKYYSDSYDRLYFWDKNDAVYTGMDATEDDALRTLVRFVPVEVSGYDEGNTYYLEFATGRMAYLYDNNDNNYVRLYLNGEYKTAIYAYNISDSIGHFGFYVASETQTRLYGGASKDNLYVTSYSSGPASVVNAQYDFAIYPAVKLEDDDLLKAAFEDCVAAYTECVEFLATAVAGTAPGCYDADALAALQAAVDAAADCGKDDAQASDNDKETWQSLTSSLNSALNAAEATMVKDYFPTDGYYFLELAGVTTMANEPAIYENDNNYAVWADLQKEAKYLWAVTAQGDGSYTITNTATEETFDDFVTSGSDWTTMSINENAFVFNFVKLNDEGEVVFTLEQYGNTKSRMYITGDSSSGPTQSTSGSVYSWTGTSNQSYFKLVEASAEEVYEILGIETEPNDTTEERTLTLSEPIETVADIQQGQWYVIASNSSSIYYEPYTFLYQKATDYDYDYVYVWGGEGQVETGQPVDSEAAQRTLVRFIPASVEGYEDTYYIQFATGRYLRIPNSSNATCKAYENIDDANPVCIYNIAETAQHFGIYDTDSSNFRLYAWAGTEDGWTCAWSSGQTSTLNGSYDFAIIPAMELTDEELQEAAWTSCVETYNRYTAFLATAQTGTEPGNYSEEALSVLSAAVAAADGCAEAEATSKSTEEWNALTVAMNDAYSIARAGKVSVVTPEDGNYYIEPAGYEFIEEMAIYDDPDYTSYVSWGPLDTTDKRFAWSLTAQGDGSYDVRNVETNKAFDEFVTTSYAYVTVSEDSEIKLVFEYSDTNEAGEYIVKVHTSTNNVGYMWAQNTSDGTGTHGYIYSWAGSDSDCLWKLVPAVVDEETGINAAEAAEVENGAIYTIQGIRISGMSQPGIYIQNGKKILVK
ncbi:MAG: hypothetical protein LUC44_07805 [Prevotellaceae bacterium]|nr:hypothetical protein [Prevotellaceae bacterium]